MIYVFDTSSIRVMSNYYPETFATFWSSLAQEVATGNIVSVREAYTELIDMKDRPISIKWAKDNRKLFREPTLDEQQIVSDILAVPHYRSLVSARSILNGRPVADPFIIAAAKHLSGTVVTEESMPANGAKIPNICQKLQIPCINLANFLKQKGWKF